MRLKNSSFPSSRYALDLNSSNRPRRDLYSFMRNNLELFIIIIRSQVTRGKGGVSLLLHRVDAFVLIDVRFQQTLAIVKRMTPKTTTILNRKLRFPPLLSFLWIPLALSKHPVHQLKIPGTRSNFAYNYLFTNGLDFLWGSGY